MQLAVASALLGSLPLAARAQREVYPERPMTLIVPFTAAGGTDLTARIFARVLEKYAKQSVMVLNRAGAGGEIGMAQVSRSAPDGYTLGLLNTPNVVSIPIEREAQFQLASFDPLASLVDDPATLSVHGDSPVRSLQDLVALARQRPDELHYGTAGVGSAGHLSLLLLQQKTGIRLRHVPYKGTADVRTALLGRQLDVAAVNLSEALAFGEGVPWRTLGVMSQARSPFVPTLPTFTEAGYPILWGSLRGIGVPKGLPPECRAKLSAMVIDAAKDSRFIGDTKVAKQEVRLLAGDEYVKELLRQRDQLQALWNTSPWQV
ncbi:hypothetical protein ASB57_11690 [Bordetella sp. N]|nr:hypothetical protein ASB57_11690 [Bordetella sp. N]